MAKKSESISASELVDMLKTELDGAIDRLSAKLVDDSSPTTTPTEKPTMQLFKLDGKTQLVAQLGGDLPSGEYKVVVSVKSADSASPSRCFIDDPCCDSLNCTVLG